MDSSRTIFYLHAVLTVLHYLNSFISGHICQQKLTRPALVGFRCVTDSVVYMTIIGIEQHICTYECVIRKECSFVSYNIEQNICHLSNDTCVVLEADQAFQVKYLGNVHRSECLQWLPPATFDSIRTVGNPLCHDPFPTPCYVGRLLSASNILPGKYFLDPERVWTVLNGGSSYTGTMEILHVRTGCQVTWTPFNAGDVVPVGAVEGGYLSSSGANLYVMRAPFENYILIGYYDPNSVTGYMSYWGMKMVTNMELLVLLSSWGFPSHIVSQNYCKGVIDTKTSMAIGSVINEWLSNIKTFNWLCQYRQLENLRLQCNNYRTRIVSYNRASWAWYDIAVCAISNWKRAMTRL